jgi:hypothetical protein
MVLRKVLQIITLLLAFVTYTNAQAPWRAKLFVHFLDSNNQMVTDTVWFGCDSLGDIGYQAGLDVIDTSMQRNKVYSSDNLVKSQFNTDCANLKTNIQAFVPRSSTFLFYALGNPVSISWDTSDFRYIYDSVQRISIIQLIGLTGYLRFMDAVYFQLGGDGYTLGPGGKIVYTGFRLNPMRSTEILKESNLSQNCSSVKEGFAFLLEIYYGWWVGDKKVNSNTPFAHYPVPVKDMLHVETGIANTVFKIICTDYIGRTQDTQTANTDHSGNLSIDYSKLPSGNYILYINEESQQVINKPLKISKR